MSDKEDNISTNTEPYNGETSTGNCTGNKTNDENSVKYLANQAMEIMKILTPIIQNNQILKNMTTDFKIDKEQNKSSPRTNVQKGTYEYSSSRSNDNKSEDEMPKSKKARLMKPTSTIVIPERPVVDEISIPSESFDIENSLLDNEEEGPPLQEELSQIAKKLKERKMSKEKIAEKAKTHLKPKNCNFETKNVNSEIWSKVMNSQERSIDLKLQKTEKLITKAIYANLKVTEDLLKIKSMKECDKVYIKNTIVNSMDALALMSTAHATSEGFRRELITNKLVHEQKAIGNNLPVNYENLFEDDLSKKLSEVSGASKTKLKRAFSNISTSSNEKEGYSKNFRRFSKIPEEPKLRVQKDFEQNKTKNLKTHDENKYQGGKISKYLHNWEKLTQDKYILDIIKYGLKLEFIKYPPKQHSFPPNIYSKTEEESIKIEIKKFLDKKFIVECNHLGDGYVSSIFTRPKKDGSIRIILNLKKFNEYIKYKHFKMETIQHALNCITPNAYMASVDLKDAFYTIPIFKAHQKYLKFQFQGKFYKFTCMPMGYGPSMRVFTKVLKVPYSHLRKQEHISAIYVDDNLLIGKSYDECEENIKDTKIMLTNLGFTPHLIKSVLEPTQKITYLGFTIDSRDMTITLTGDKKAKILNACNEAIDKKVIKIRNLAKIIGKIVAALPATKYGNLYYKELEMLKIKALRKNSGNFEAFEILNKEAIHELKWWKENISKCFNYIKATNVDKIIYTDASKAGWGISSENETNGGRWEPQEKELHINVLELKAIGIGIKSFYKTEHKHLRLMSDNATAIAYINNMGGVKSKECNTVTREIWEWCIKRNLWISAAYIPGKSNITADKASRKFNDAIEWKLDTNVFNNITQKLGRPTIDLFASKDNRQLKRYMAWKPDPDATAIDAMTSDWGDEFSYIFPPFSLIGAVTEKIQREKARCIVIVPEWPTQYWYPILQRLANKQIKLPMNQNTLTLAHDHNKIHPLLPGLQLIAILID